MRNNRNSTSDRRTGRSSTDRFGLLGFATGAVIAAVVVGAAVVGAAANDQTSDAPLKSPTYCKTAGRCGDAVYQEPTPTRAEALVRFENGKSIDLSSADLGQLRSIVNASICPIVAKGATTTDESKEAARRLVESGDFQRNLEGLWAPDRLTAFVDDTRKGQVIADSIGRHIPIGCSLSGYTVVRTVEDATGIVVEVRYQIRRQFPIDAVGTSDIEALDDQGLAKPVKALEYSHLYVLRRGDDGTLLAESETFYRDPDSENSGI